MCYRLGIGIINVVIQANKIRGEFIKTSGVGKQHLDWRGGWWVVYICEKRPPFPKDQKGSMKNWPQSFWRQLESIL